MKHSLCKNPLSSLGSVEEAKLIDDIFKGYNKKARPVRDVKGTVQLRFDIALKQILDVVSNFNKVYQLLLFGYVLKLLLQTQD